MDGFIRIEDIDQIPDDEGFVAEVDGKEVAIFRCAEEYFAVENCCPHRGGPVAEGEYEEGVVTCPWHAWPFDVRSGKCMINDSARLATYEIRLKSGHLWVKASA